MPINRYEYVWIDGYNPATLRSKVKIKEGPADDWSFDGSSTLQANEEDTECIIRPVRRYDNPINGGYFVLCEVLNSKSLPIKSNKRRFVHNDDTDFWFGFEQEYFLFDENDPIGWDEKLKQGPYYCGVGYPNIRCRDFAEEHMYICNKAGITLEGINAEVAVGQWEFQVFAMSGKKAADDLWMARYILYKLSEKYRYKIVLEPKPMPNPWNGSGLHTNFSTGYMRKTAFKNYFIKLCEKFKKMHSKHILVSGLGNNERLLGACEAPDMKEFSYGVGTRNTSIRIPGSTAERWAGHIEDRRPGSNADPYEIVKYIIDTIRGE